MTSAKKKEDIEFAGATIVGKASIRADLKALQDEHRQKLSDDVKHSGDTISHTIVPSRQARECAWNEAVRTRDEIYASPNRIVAAACVVGTALTTVMTGLALPDRLDPVIAYSICAFAFTLAAAFFAVGYDYICRGGYPSSLSGVFSSPITGFYPWMRERVLIASGDAWGIGGKGLYIPRFPRDEYEPYHNVVAYETIINVEVSFGTGIEKRDYPAHLIVYTSDRPSDGFVFADATTSDGLTALELADLIKSRIGTRK